MSKLLTYESADPKSLRERCNPCLGVVTHSPARLQHSLNSSKETKATFICAITACLLLPITIGYSATVQSINGVSTTGYIEAVSATGSWLATQAEAEAGINNDQIMTPLRVKQAMTSNMAGSDRISTSAVASGSSLGMVVADRGTISFTLAGTEGAAYLHGTAGLVAPAVSTTTGNVQALRVLNSVAGEAVGTPGFSWSGDSNTGMYWVGADQLGLTTGGVQRMLVNSTGVRVTGIVTATSYEGDGSKLSNLPQGTTTLTGNVTGSGTGSIATTIANNAVTTARIADSAVTLAKIQNISTNMLLGRASAATGNVEQITIGTGLELSGTTLSVPSTADNLGDHTATTTIKATNGTAALPAYTFAGDTNTGLYWVAADQVGLTTGGTQRLLVNSSGLRVVGYVSTTGVIDAGAAIYGFAGDSVTAPGYTWSGDTNTGMYWVGADQIGFTAGGTQRFRVHTTGATATGALTADTAAGGWLATQAEAEAGTNNDHIMTPLRVLQAITKALSSASTVPTGAVMAFDLTSCPTGWSEYTPARGRFLRGIDNGAGNDPSGNRTPGDIQADMLASHTHTAYASNNDRNDAATQGWPVNNAHNTFRTSDRPRENAVDSQAISQTGGAETRPKNVAVLYCRKN